MNGRVGRCGKPQRRTLADLTVCESGRCPGVSGNLSAVSKAQADAPRIFYSCDNLSPHHTCCLPASTRFQIFSPHSSKVTWES